MAFRNMMVGPDFGRENLLHLSWYDSSWIPVLNQQNVMDYFSERSNPFYDKTCNNEIIKMQRLSPEHLSNMTGVEFVLLHVQEPILYVVRKQQRHSPTQATPMADFYILSGVIYQAPDLCSVINSRLLNCVHSLKAVFDEALSYSRYHQSKGYWWEFKNQKQNEVKKPVEEPRKKEEPSSQFQRQRVDILLSELAKSFPLKVNQPAVQAPPPERNVSVKDALDASKELVAKALAEKRPAEGEKRPPAKSGASDVSSASSGDNRPPPEKKPKMLR